MELFFSRKCKFLAQAHKIKKKKKKPTLNKILSFLQKKDLLYFRNLNFLLFQETKLSYILRNGNPKKLFIFQESKFPSSKK